MRIALTYIYCESILSLVDVELPTHFFTPKYIHLICGYEISGWSLSRVFNNYICI